MASRPQDTRPSVITSILGVVGRELQQFVLNAAGVSASAPTIQEADKSPARPRKRRYNAVGDEQGTEDSRPTKRSRQDHSEVLPSSPYSSPDPSDARKPKRLPPSTQKPEPTGHTYKADTHRRSAMPGALYEQSESEYDVQEDRRVRFARDTASPALPPRRSSSSPLSNTETIMRSFPRLNYDVEKVTPPPSTADEEESLSFSQSQAVRSPEADFVPLHSRIGSDTRSASSLNDYEVRHRLRDTVNSLRAAEGASFTSMTSERSFEQERIAELEREVKKLREEVRV